MISAKVICDSVSEAGIRITTMELNYPRIIHSELMTHRMFSRNAASSRAIPFEKMLQQLDGIPSRFGAAKAGMQDDGSEHNGLVSLEVYKDFDEPSDSGLLTVETAQITATAAWHWARDSATEFSKAFKDAGFHKQVYNRLTEPFQMIKVVVTATEWENFFWLRDDVMADPTLKELAGKMKVAMSESEPKLLREGEYHLPYVDVHYFCDDNFTPPYFEQKYLVNDTNGQGFFVSLEDAIKVSAARCAAVSYRNEDYGLEKCKQLYERLVGDERKHSSALEHIATPIKVARCEPREGFIFVNDPAESDTWQEGVSHVDKSGQLWSANFKEWVQYRKTLKDECYYGEQK